MCVCVVCVCASTAPGVCALGWVKCREQNFTAGYTLYEEENNNNNIIIQNQFFFLQNQ